MSDVYKLNDCWIIDDCYNSNPASMRAAVETLIHSAGGKPAFAVLGDMLELGKESPGYHFEMGRYAAAIGVKELVCVGKLSKLIAQGAKEAGCTNLYECENPENAAAIISSWTNEGDWILVKGSRGIQLERAILALKNIWSIQEEKKRTQPCR